MKKYLFIALAAAGMLTSCSTDDTVANERTNGEELVPIKIGMGNIVTNVTRGTGTVGVDPTDPSVINNLWNGELVNITMFNKGLLTLAQAGNPAADIFFNEEFKTPTGADGTAADDYAKPTDNEVRYYPTTGEFDFYGFRLDDAGNPLTAAVNGDAYTVDFDIDGTQDLLAAKSTPAAGDGYSAKASRNGVDPQLKFKHLLSRLTFEVKAANANAAGTLDKDQDGNADGNPVVITGITVKSKHQGTLTIANAAGDEPSAAFEDGTTDMALAGLDATNTFPLQGTTLNAGTDYAQIEDAILVAPGEATYDLVVSLKQTKVKDYTDPAVTEDAETTLNATITIPGAVGTVAEAGTSYKVQIMIYGLEEIKVYTTLTPWVESADPITIDPDANI
jgi:hypothetical protein